MIALILAVVMTLKLTGDQSQWNAPVYLQANQRVDFGVDTGSQIEVLMDNALLYKLYDAGHAHQVASDYVSGIDGSAQLMPVYEVDELTVGKCRVPGPIRVHATAGTNVLGSLFLASLRAVFDVGKGTLTFECPGVKK